MMILKSFVAHEIINFLESELMAREPQLAQILMDDIQHELNLLLQWFNNKLQSYPNKHLQGE